MKSPEQLLRALYDAYRRGDLTAFPEMIDPDCEWFFPGDPAILPWAGKFRGLGIFDFAARVGGSIDYLEFDDHTYYPAGETVVVVIQERCRVKSTGREFVNAIVAVATVGNGRLLRYVEYSDTGAMERAFQPGSGPSKL